jgi:hypothetical protein
MTHDQSYTVYATARLEIQITADSDRMAVNKAGELIRDTLEDTDIRMLGGMLEISAELNANKDEHDR